MNKYFYFPDPLTTPLVMQVDLPPGTPPIPGLSDVHASGRRAISFLIPPEVATGTGVAILPQDGSIPAVMRGTIILAGLDTYVRWDDVHYVNLVNTSLARFEPDGVRLRAAGKPIVWAMMSGFCDYKLWVTGRKADCRALWSEARDLGAHGRRVFGMMHHITRFYPQEHPNYLSELQPFVAEAAQYGQRIHFDVFADNQEVKLGEPFWLQVRAQLEPMASVLLGAGNEWPKNGFDPFALSRPGVIASQGSALSDAAPPMPGWGVRMWHGRRDYPKSFMSFDDAIYVGRGLDEHVHQYAPVAPVVHDEPIGFAEVEVPNRRSTDPILAQCLMLTGRAYGAGATFHCEDGIFSRPLGPVQQTCARAFFDVQG